MKNSDRKKAKVKAETRLKRVEFRQKQRKQTKPLLASKDLYGNAALKEKAASGGMVLNSQNS